MPHSRSIKAWSGAALVLLTSACASTGANQGTDPNDPWEETNRSIYAFNKAVDQNIYKPVAGAYRAVVPKAPRQGVSNVMRNLREPWTFVNDILQLKFKRAGRTLGRFVVNSTIGMAGLLKISDKMDIPHHSEDLGQTLAVWGFRDTPYFIIPFVGPSNVVDTVGFGSYVFADPVTIGISKMNVEGLNLTRTGLDALDLRSRTYDVLNDLYQDPDGYILMRSSYRQQRLYEIYDGNPPQADNDIFDELEDEDFEEDTPENE